MKQYFHIILTILICSTVFFICDSSAQEIQIQTDRPDQSESPVVIPVNHFQIESGIVFEKDTEDGLTTKSLSYPSLLLRYGVFKNFELRLGMENVHTSSEINGLQVNSYGIKPVNIGFKVNVCGEKGLRPDAGIVINWDLPKIASDDYKEYNLSTSINLVFNNSLSDNLSAGYNLGFSWDGETAEATYFYTLSFGYELTKHLSCFLEGYGFIPEQTQADHRLDFGMSLIALNNLSFDASAGFGITKNAPDFFVNGGVSIRIPR